MYRQLSQVGVVSTCGTRQGIWAYRMRQQKELLESPVLPDLQIAAYQFPSRHGALVQHWNPALADAMHSSQPLEFEQGLFYALLDATGSEPWMAICATCFYVNTIPERIHFQFFIIIVLAHCWWDFFGVPNLQWFSGFFRTYWLKKTRIDAIQVVLYELRKPKLWSHIG